MVQKETASQGSRESPRCCFTFVQTQINGEEPPTDDSSPHHDPEKSKDGGSEVKAFEGYTIFKRDQGDSEDATTPERI